MKQLLATIVLVFTTGYAFSQQDSLPAATDIDPSKPTNLYTQVNLALESQSGNGTDVYGIRTNIQYAPNADNLFVVEVPVLCNSNTSSFGISDPRVRYFKAVKGNWKTYWSGEMNLNKIIVPNKLKVNAYWSPNFTTEVHTVRVGAHFSYKAERLIYCESGIVRS